MRVSFTPQGWQHFTYWTSGDRKVYRRLIRLIEETRRAPFSGLGKPEPLRNELKGWWSRRIDDEHRLIYRVTGSDENQTLEIAACRFHYRR